MNELGLALQVGSSAPEGSAQGEHDKARATSNGPKEAGGAEFVKQLQMLLDTTRQRLSFLLIQRATFGVHTFAYIHTDIKDACNEIRRIKQNLRDLKQNVDDRPEDNSDQSADGVAGKSETYSLIEQEYLEKTAEVYTAPPGIYEKAAKLLNENRIAVLCGSAEMGTRMTGVRLLHALLGEKIYQWDPTTIISTLQGSVAAQNEQDARAHLVHQMKLDGQAHLGKYALQKLSSQLEQHKSYLVITIDDAPALIRDQIADYLVAWDVAPEDRATLLEQHLSWYLRKSEHTAKAHALCQRSEVRSLIGKSSPGKINRLAHDLADAIDDETKIQAALDDFGLAASEQIAAWFAEHTDLEHCAFLITLAVLDGAKAPSIIKAAQSFLLRIKPQPRDGDPPESAPLFARPRRRWIEACRAHVVSDHERTPFGEARIERIELNDPEFSWSIIEYVWREHAHFHGPMLDWLRELLDSADSGVRERAATTTGGLCTIDFEEVYTHILLPYARHYEPYRWEAIASILNVLLINNAYAEYAQQLLRQWSTQEKEWALPWTAAVIYGQFTGLFFTNQALADLRKIALRKDTRLTGAVHTSIFTLFYFAQQEDDKLHIDQQEDDKLYDQILKALDEWTSNGKDTNLITTGLSIVLSLSEQNITIEGTEWPTLLWLQHNNSARREHIITLWRRALNGEHSREPGLQRLARWLEHADKHPQIYPAAEQLVGELVRRGSTREKDRLFFHLRRWAARYKGKLRSAEQILSAIH